MNLKDLKKYIGMLALILFSAMAFSSCSDDKDDEPNPDPIDSELPYLGAWRVDWDEEEISFFVFDESNVVTYYETDPENLKKDRYTYKDKGSYKYYSDDKTLYVTIDGESDYLDVKGKGDNTYLEFPDGERARRVARSAVPTEKASESTPSTKDALSNTTWKFSKFTGWGADSDNSAYNNMELRFGSNGNFTEWYSSSKSYTGTYSISGSTLTLNGSTWLTSDWNHTYYFTISGSNLTLEVPKWDTYIHFTKK